MALLELADLKLNLGGKDILNGISLEIKESTINSIIGPNGAGKSTLANTLMGLSGYREYLGEITYNKKSLKDLDVYERSKLGITLGWQEPARFEGISVEKFLSAAAKDKSKDNIENSLRKVGLRPCEYISRKVDKTLSGGERKRIEVASILLMEPKLVILDEPDSGIDVQALDNIFDALSYLKKKGTTIILITHSKAVLENSEYAYLLCNGKIIDQGSSNEIKKYFEHKCINCGHKNIPKKEELNLSGDQN